MLEVSRAGARRVLHLLEGDPVAFSSTVPGDGLASILVQAAGLSAERAREWVDTEAPGVDVLDARIASGDLTPEAAQATWRAWLTHGVRAPLEWSGGVWVFRREPALTAGCVDPALLPGVTSLGTLRGSLDALVPADVALADARERAAPLHPGPRHDHLAPELGLPPALAHAIAAGGLLDPLVRADHPASIEIARLVWLLVRLRVVSSGGGPAPADLLVQLLGAGRGPPATLAARAAPAPRAARPGASTLPRGMPRATPQPPAGGPSPNAVVTMLRVDRDTRLGRDPHRFLGVKVGDGDDRIALAVQRLGARWRDAHRDPRIDAEARATAEALLDQLEGVAREMQDPDRRAALESRLAPPASPFALDPDLDDPLLQTVEFEVEETR